jgi:succinate-semialdehyde dehydrogenase/glutarate-semialdehyde dehydrogenase
MSAAADILDQQTDRFANLITTEMGKPIRQAKSEVAKCAWVCRYYAENAADFLREEPVKTDAIESHISFRPLGPVLAVMPWNFPFWQVFRFAAPALMAGNTALLKHASNVLRCAVTIEEIFRSAGFPEGVFQTLLISSDQVEQVLASDHVKAVTLTGSEAAGSAVASLAGEHVKKSVLELGGSDPFIVMPSADLEKAVETGVKARILNSGQSCIAAKRFILDSRIADDFEARFRHAFEKLRGGDPMNPETEVGPLATERGLETLEEQVRQSERQGAQILTGGYRLPEHGYHYCPTILSEPPEASPASREEIFGPVASLFRVSGVKEAIQAANDTPFGLAAAIWTREADEREQFLDGIEAGTLCFNGMVRSDPRLPFGGVKRSGYGRELSRAGIREFVSVQSVSREA